MDQRRKKKTTHVSDVMTSKGNQAAQCAGGFRGGLGGKPTGSDEHLISPDLPEELVRLQFVVIAVFDTGDTRFDGVKISEVREPFLGLRDEVGEGWFRVLHPHSLPGVPRGDTESNSVFANGFANGFDDLEREPGTVLNRSAVFVCPLVRDVLEELVWEVSVGGVELDAVESGLVDGSVSGSGVPLDVGLDLFDRQRTRDRVGRGHGDSGRGDQFEIGVFGLERFNFRAATESPKLEENIRAVGVDCVYNLHDRKVRQRVVCVCQGYVPSSSSGPDHRRRYTEHGGTPQLLGGWWWPR